MMTRPLLIACVATLISSEGSGARAAPEKRVPIGYGAQFVRRDACRSSGVPRKGIFAHPPWKGARGRVVGLFVLDLSKAREPVLAFRMGIQDGHGSDKGLVYRVDVEARGERKVLLKEFYKDNVWSDVQRVSLQPYVGHVIRLELAVDSLGEHYANWGEPRIMDDGKALYDLADMAEKAEKFVELRNSLAPEDLPENMRLQREREAREAAGVRPSRQQIAWQELEFIAFAHFGINTFTDREWGDGREDPALFNPTSFDARQWVRVLNDAGIKLLILTCKHHDGFCLWPSAYTEHSVKKSPWKGGRGDVVREVADACREGGVRFGVYLSPWDRNHPSYGDSPRYNEYFKKQLTELLTNYGPITEVWFDGACGEGPNGKRQVYDWQGYYETVCKCQPDALIAISGPDVRWVGNESGVARETEWSVQRGKPAIHGHDRLVWWPAECDVSIRPGWFYHASQDDKVKSLRHLVDIYYKSVGRNSVLLLNIPPDRRGLIHENDHRRLVELRKVLDVTFRRNLIAGSVAKAGSVRASDSECGAEKAVDGDPATFWAPEDGVLPASIEIDLGRPVTFNRSMVQEFLPEGQHVEEYVFEAWDGGAGGTWRPFARGTTIGHKKLDRFGDVTAAKVRLTIMRARSAPKIRELGLFSAPARP